MKILIVDDEVIVAKSLMRAFASKGHEVSICHNGEEGLDLWISEKPDVVFLDVLMPGLTGPQVIEEYFKKVSKESSRHFVVLMTAHSSVKHRESALELGANDFIQKPFDDVFEVVKRIENLIKDRGK